MYGYDDDLTGARRPAMRLARTSRQRRPADPFRRRLGVLVLGFVLLVPVFLALRGNGPSVRSADAPGAVAVVEPVLGGDASATTEATAPAPTAPASTDTVAPTTAAPAPLAAVPSAGAVAAEPAEREPEQSAAASSCTRTYEVRIGDYWLKIADIHGVALADVLAANGATVNTPLFAGRDVCLPANAGPTPAATAPHSPITTAAPAPAPAPPTTAAPAPAGSTRDQVIAIIRYVWPDELEDRAIQIATRESNLIPTAKNSCCYGLFQIYYSVHKSWLAGLGITSATQLFDPAKNSLAAYTLYQRSGGWGPWGY